MFFIKKFLEWVRLKYIREILVVVDSIDKAEKGKKYYAKKIRKDALKTGCK